MSLQQQPMITCANCGNPFQAEVSQILDLSRDPSAKTRLVSGRANVAQCPHCGFQNQVAMPLVYHDPAKELLLINVPMELGLSQTEQEAVIGRFIRDITESLPQAQRKGYLLNPRRTFTLQGMIDTVLEEDGITKEMIAERQEKLQLVEKLLQTPPDKLEALVQQYDEQLDGEFFEVLMMTVEAALQSGDQASAQQIVNIRDAILPLTSYGTELLAVSEEQEALMRRFAADFQALGKDVTRETLAQLAVDHAEEEEYLHVFASALQAELDYQFFEVLTNIAENDRNKKTRRKATQARETLIETLDVINASNQERAQQAARVLQAIVHSGNIEAAMQQNLGMIDDMFMAVLEGNLQEAHQRQDTELVQRLGQVQEFINELIMQNSPPEVRLINELIMIEDQLELRLRLVDEAPQYGDTLLQYLEALIAQLEARGDRNMLDRLNQIYVEAQKVLQPE